MADTPDTSDDDDLETRAPPPGYTLLPDHNFSDDEDTAEGGSDDVSHESASDENDSGLCEKQVETVDVDRAGELGIMHQGVPTLSTASLEEFEERRASSCEGEPLQTEAAVALDSQVEVGLGEEKE